MAIASLLVTVLRERTLSLTATLAARSDIVEKKCLPPDNADASLERWALVLECPATRLTETLTDLTNIPGVVELNLVFANYEDDLP